MRLLLLTLLSNAVRPQVAFMRRGLLCLALCLAALSVPAGVWAQSPSADAALDAARAQIDGLQKQLNGDVAEIDLGKLRDTALGLQTETDRIAGELEPLLANVQARLAELGPKAEGVVEPPDVAAQRAALDKSRAQLDAQIKLARLLSVEGGQAADAASGLRRQRFQARLGERTASILAPPFWLELRNNAPRDLQRVQALAQEARLSAQSTPLGVWAGLALACVAVLALRVLAGRWLLRATARRVPAGRLRRSLLALAFTLLAVVVPTFIAHALRLAVTWQRPPSDALGSWLIGVVGVVGFASFTSGLAGALLSARRPSWRLPSVPDGVAQQIRRYPSLLALVLVVGSSAERLAGAVNASLATAVAINCLFALALGLLMAHMLRRGRLLRRAAEAEGAAVAPAWLSTLSAGAWVLLIASLLCVLVGYVALGSFAVKQVVWIATIGATAYLLSAVLDDLFIGWLASPQSAPEGEGAEPKPPQLRDQAAVLLSGASRLAVLLVAAVLIVAPFGQGPAELFARADQLREGIAVGEIAVRPASVLQALLVFAIGMACVRGLQHWLTHRYLPTTRLDAGMRTSATTLLGFVGAIFAVALALSAVGLGLERVAWVASALSVGIGFGLQAVVSNFVSGLILLAERPVKVGDWVSLGGVEGDIRRINVRATEIQMGDRSTVIVPNSEFITKTVRNVTHANPLGLVQIKLPMPLDTPVDRVRDLMLAAFTEHADVLDTPAPAVLLDAIDASSLTFNATGFVSSPRKSYATKSALLFDILKRLADAQITMLRSPTMVLREAPPTGPKAS